VDAIDPVTPSARSVAGLLPALARLRCDPPARAEIDAAIARGYFRPDEEEHLREWFARYLTARAALRETIADLAPVAWGRVPGGEDVQLRAFAVAFCAACQLVQAARILVRDVAPHPLVQRKLNEASPRHRIPRKQYTEVYRALTLPINAWRLSEAIAFGQRNRLAIAALAAEPLFAPAVEGIASAEESLRVSVPAYVKARLRYRWHSWRRRRASAGQKAIFRLLEGVGRVVADVRVPWHRDRVSAAVREEVAALLRPGDVIVARHDRAMSNLFLPGYWPHAALHVGGPDAARSLCVKVDPDRAARWVDPLRILEARKDGVRLRALDDTLAVDAFAVIRPALAAPQVARAIANALGHEGKLYNFDFDFFTDDRLVCTEVVYRAYEGIGGITIPLVRRGGRMTLSAEDLLDVAVEGRGFEPVAVFGAPNVGNRLVTGAGVRDALAASYR
jgi:hypothetical protein